MLNYSFVVLVFITIETRLMKACDLISKSRALPVRAKDMAGNGFERYMSFLTKLVNIPREKLTLWPRISRLRDHQKLYSAHIGFCGIFK